MPDHPICKICKKSIPIDAKVCTECDHYQDWRRYLTIGSSSLSLIIALISVIGLTAPTFYELLFRKDSFQLLAVRNGETFSVFVRNPTDEVGYVRGVDLVVAQGLRSRIAFENQEIDGNTTWSYPFVLTPADAKNMRNSTDCFLEVSYVLGELALRSIQKAVECSAN